MPSTPERGDATFSATDPEFIRMQLEQAYETFRSQLTLATQAFAILITVNVTMLGFAVAQQLASVLFVAALFPVAMLFIAYIVIRAAVPVLYTIVRLEQMYTGADTDSLGSIFVALFESPEYVRQLRAVSSLPAATERAARLRQLPIPWMGRWKGLIRLALVLLAVGQAIAAIVLAVSFNWRFL